MRKCIIEPAEATLIVRQYGLLPIRAGLVLGGHLVEVVHPDDADVCARGDRLQPVLGLAPAERPDARAEPEEELGDLHPARTCAVR